MPFHGRVNGDTQRITLRIRVSNGERDYREIEFEVDTASDEELAMQPRDIVELGLTRSIDADYRHNGVSSGTPAYAAQVEWHDGPIAVNVVETERPPYVGMGLLWDSYLSAYLFPNGAVTVSRMVHWDDLKREAAEE